MFKEVYSLLQSGRSIIKELRERKLGLPNQYWVPSAAITQSSGAAGTILKHNTKVKIHFILDWNKSCSLDCITPTSSPSKVLLLGSRKLRTKKLRNLELSLEQRAFPKGNHPITCSQLHCLPAKTTTPRCQGGQPPAQAPPLPSTLRQAHSTLLTCFYLIYSLTNTWTTPFLEQWICPPASRSHSF